MSIARNRETDAVPPNTRQNNTRAGRQYLSLIIHTNNIDKSPINFTKNNITVAKEKIHSQTNLTTTAQLRTALHNTAPLSTTPYYSPQHRTTHHNTALLFTTLHYTSQHCTTLHNTALHFTTLHHSSLNTKGHNFAIFTPKYFK